MSLIVPAFLYPWIRLFAKSCLDSLGLMSWLTLVIHGSKTCWLAVVALEVNL